MGGWVAEEVGDSVEESRLDEASDRTPDLDVQEQKDPRKALMCKKSGRKDPYNDWRQF
jgi:hypothetical protein